MIDPVISVCLRCLLAIVFATAAWHKASDIRRFRRVLDAYRLVPSAFSHAAAWSVPAIEVVLACGLLLPGYRWAAWGAAVMLLAYSAAIAVNLARGRRDIDCGCFGPAASVPLSGSLLVRNAILVAAAGIATSSLRPRPLVWVDGFTVLFVIAAAVLLWTSFWRLRRVRVQEGP